MNTKTTLHRDGTITTWDVYTQSWFRGVPSVQMLASMSSAERERVQRHIARHAAR